MTFFEVIFLKLFFNVLVTFGWETNTDLEGLKLENSENMIRPACDSQSPCVYTGGKTRAEVAAKI